CAWLNQNELRNDCGARIGIAVEVDSQTETTFSWIICIKRERQRLGFVGAVPAEAWLVQIARSFETRIVQLADSGRSMIYRPEQSSFFEAFSGDQFLKVLPSLLLGGRAGAAEHFDRIACFAALF